MVDGDTKSVLLQMRGIVKHFPGAKALDGVDLEVRAGEVHCLLGQNGAGKSTLIKVLSGAHQPDAGIIELDGQEVRIASPVRALALGVATMYQELDVVEGLSIAENVFLGHELASAGLTRRHDANRATRDILARLGHSDLRPGRQVGTLSAAGKQIVSMARALSHHAKIIVMDEPSAVLDSEEVENLFRVVEALRDEGVAVIYISHRLDEIRRIGDRITVLKDGRTVAVNLPAESTSSAEVIRLMTGRSVEHAIPPRENPAPLSTEPLLTVSGLALKGVFHDVGFAVRPGEIVGLAGLVGSGRSEILETVYGARRATAGTVSLAGRPLRAGSVPAAVRAGIGLCPEERKSQGLVLDEAIYRNITLSTFQCFANFGLLNETAERHASEAQAESLDLRPVNVRRPARTLSGGNQQKLLLARWLEHGCRVLLLDEPTRGVDVGARTEIYQLINRLADAGTAIVVVSSELPEVIGLSDRLLVVADGRVVADRPAGELTEEDILDLVMEGNAA